MKIHQGDVILIPIDSIPKSAKFLEEEIIARGEITGHAHWIPKARIYAESPVNGIRKKYVEVLDRPDTTMYHGMESTRTLGTDHPSIKDVAPGKYRVQIQTEFFPDFKREVKD